MGHSLVQGVWDTVLCVGCEVQSCAGGVGCSLVQGAWGAVLFVCGGGVTNMRCNSEGVGQLTSGAGQHTCACGGGDGAIG